MEDKKKQTKKELMGLAEYSIGMIGGIEPSSILHELGHALAIKLAGGEPELYLLSDKAHVFYSPSGIPKTLQTVITAAGPSTNVAAVGASLGLSTRVKNKKLKHVLRGFSLINAMSVALYVISDYFGFTHGDFSSLASDGIGYEYTVPLSLLGLAAVSTYIYISEKKSGKKKKIRKKSDPIEDDPIPVPGEFYDITK